MRTWKLARRRSVAWKASDIVQGTVNGAQCFDKSPRRQVLFYKSKLHSHSFWAAIVYLSALIQYWATFVRNRTATAMHCCCFKPPILTVMRKLFRMPICELEVKQTSHSVARTITFELLLNLRRRSHFGWKGGGSSPDRALCRAMYVEISLFPHFGTRIPWW